MKAWLLSVPASVLGSIVLLSSPAAAEDADVATDPRCDGTFSVLRPRPAECMAPIDTDRPHKTDTPHTTPEGHAQVELGLVEYEKASFRGPSQDNVVVMNNIYKLGIASGVDAQILYAAGSYAMRTKRFQLDSQLMFRTKLGVWGSNESPFMVSLVPAVVVPVRSGGRVEGGGFAFIGAELPWDLDFELDVGAISETDPDTARRHAVTVGTVAVTRHVAGPVSVFGELYSETLSSDPAAVSSTADTGVLVALGNDAQLDVGSYNGLWGNVPAFTPFLGLSVRR